ncbi:FUSC family protein [Burkholderia glumae]|nr:hypothetical protein [Burkholderia glumae]MCM2546493.1 FUSC family protein [Burkholderia glumae]
MLRLLAGLFEAPALARLLRAQRSVELATRAIQRTRTAWEAAPEQRLLMRRVLAGLHFVRSALLEHDARSFAHGAALADRKGATPIPSRKWKDANHRNGLIDRGRAPRVTTPLQRQRHSLRKFDMKSLQLALAALLVSTAGLAQAQAATGADQPAPKAHASQSPRPAAARNPDACVGPASFCNIYFGS